MRGERELWLFYYCINRFRYLFLRFIIFRDRTGAHIRGYLFVAGGSFLFFCDPIWIKKKLGLICARQLVPLIWRIITLGIVDDNYVLLPAFLVLMAAWCSCSKTSLATTRVLCIPTRSPVLMIPKILLWEDACNFTIKISASSIKVCLEVFFGSVNSGFNLIIRAHDVVKQSSHFLFLKLGMVELSTGVVGFL